MTQKVEWEGGGCLGWRGGGIGLSSFFSLLAAVSPHLADRQVYCAQVLSDVVVWWWVSTHMMEWVCVWYPVLCLTHGHKAIERHNSWGRLEYILRRFYMPNFSSFLIRGHTVGSACYVTSKDFLVKNMTHMGKLFIDLVPVQGFSEGWTHLNLSKIFHSFYMH